MSCYYDKDSKPLGLFEFAKLFEDMEYRRIGLDEVNGMEVSTVWLGLDHRYGRSGPPLIFETMIFPVGSREDLYCERYATEAEAVGGHRRAVELAVAGKVEA